MEQKEDTLKKAFDALTQDSLPTQAQKEMMLHRIMAGSAQENATGFEKLRQMVVIYPWRAAFAVSAVQAVVFTLIFGTQYTNLLLGVLGG